MSPPINFIIPGVSKCGTTSMSAWLNLHPRIFIPVEEINLFATDWEAEIDDKFSTYYRDVSDQPVIGECCTFYTTAEFLGKVWPTIRTYVPSVKILLLVRDPVNRIESSFREFHHSGPDWGLDAPYAISAALSELPVLIEDSRYLKILARIREYIPRDQIKVVFLEDMICSPDETLDECFEFVGVDSAHLSPERRPRMNRGDEKFYDTRLLRWLRNHPRLGTRLARIPVQKQHAVFSRLGLRRRFSKPLQWDDEGRRKVSGQLYSESVEFLREHGKPLDYWPRIAEFAAGCAG